MNDGAGALGLPGAFEWRGQTWEFVPYDNLAVVRQFEDWLVADAKLQLQRERDNGALTRGQHEEELRQLRRDINAKMYSWGGSICMAAVQQAAGLKQLVLLMLQGRKRSVGTETVEAIWADPAERRRVLLAMDLIREVEEADDPNGTSPAATEPTGPASTSTSCSPASPTASAPPSGPS